MTSPRIHEVPPPLSIYDCPKCKRRVADIICLNYSVTIDLEVQTVYHVGDGRAVVEDSKGNRWEEVRKLWAAGEGFLRHECKA